MRFRGLFGASAAVAAVCFSVGGQRFAAAQATLPTLTTARDVHLLPPEQAARQYPVHLRAVVTYYDPYIDLRHGALFACDRSGCIFASVPLRPILPIHAGDMVDITGISGSGDYAPIVVGREVQFVAKSHLPQNVQRVALSRLLTGAFDAQWVETEGRVRSVHLQPRNVVFEIATDGGSFPAVTLRQPGADYEALIDSLVRIRGNAAPVFNQNRQMVGVHLFFPSLREIRVIQAAPRDPYAVPVVPVSKLFRFNPDHGILHRVHVQGRVTLDWPGHMLCILDGEDGICMQTAEAVGVAAGTFVDVVGFPAINLLKPTLEDAQFRAAGAAAAPSAPVPIAAPQTIQGDLDGKLVQVDGELIGRDFSGAGPTLLLRAGRLLFPVILPPQSVADDALLLKEGSRLRITGVCIVQFDILSTNLGEGEVRPESAHILLRSVADIAVLHAPSWWTPRHTLGAFVAVGLVILAAFTWIVVLRHRVAQQTQALRLSQERLRHLSEHDALTGLPNRLLLDDRLRTALPRADRFKTCLGLLMVDADGFKSVNDALGHQAGDKLLCGLARRLCACVRATDTVARIGGDEFIVLLPDLRVPAEAEMIARKLVTAAAQPYEIEHSLAIVTISIGIVTYPEYKNDPETLMRYADEAMYAAKQKGNGFEVYQPDQARFSGKTDPPVPQDARTPTAP